jgi:hypothetical protein
VSDETARLLATHLGSLAAGSYGVVASRIGGACESMALITICFDLIVLE